MRVRPESSETLGHGRLKERPPADPLQPLRHLLPHSSGITDGDLSEFVSTCVLHRVPKGRLVGMASGAVIGLVAAGCLRVHFSDVDGSDRVLYFVPEGWCLAGVDPSATGRSNDLRVDALEPSEVWLVPDAAASRRVERVWNALAHSTLLKIQRPRWSASQGCRAAVRRFSQALSWPRTSNRSVPHRRLSRSVSGVLQQAEKACAAHTGQQPSRTPLLVRFIS
jgi:hypothetical protein